MAEAPDAKAVLEALASERDVYARILEASKRQVELARSGDAEELLKVLAEKGRMTEEAAGLAGVTRAAKADWKGFAAKLEAGEAERGRALLAEITGLLEKILAEDEACQKAVGQRREGTMEELLRMQKGRKVAEAYGKKPPQDPRFKDERK
ncbi:MAG: hypothetical protein ACYTGB_12495 [Planctomycetota bacterium]|jgi:hypothetical protein